MSKPSPDWNLITLKWAGAYLDGTPATGNLSITYGGGVMLDDDATTPMNIYPKTIVVPLTTLSVLIDGAPKEVGYAEVQVPATNDPDIDGAGGTYTLTENLTGVTSGRKDVSFPVDIGAPGGVIWLNKIIPTAPAPGTPIQVVYWADFDALETRVADLELGGGGGGGAVTLADMPAGSVIGVNYDETNSVWPARPTARTDIRVWWVGGAVGTPPLDPVAGQDIWDVPA